MELNDTYSWLWGVFALLFAAIEGAALKNKNPGDTLSEHVWKWMGIKQPDGTPKPSGYIWRRGALGVFLAWLVAHFFGAI